MITLDKYLAFPASMFFTTDEVERSLRKWNSAGGFDQLDSIHASEGELDRLVSVLAQMEDKSSSLLENPSLTEFELVISESGPLAHPHMTVVRFKRTALDAASQECAVGNDDDDYVEIAPVIDAYVSFEQNSMVDAVFTIYATQIKSRSTPGGVTGTMQKVLWLNEESPFYDYMNASYETKDFQEIFRDIKLTYLAIQRALKYRPTVFYTPTGKTISIQSEGAPVNRKRNRRRAVRMMRLNGEEVRKYSAPVRHMSCPCWGVIGHMRHYKNGKEVWIKPYRKGKQRKNPEAYVPKEYLMED